MCVCVCVCVWYWWVGTLRFSWTCLPHRVCGLLYVHCLIYGLFLHCPLLIESWLFVSCIPMAICLMSIEFKTTGLIRSSHFQTDLKNWTILFRHLQYVHVLFPGNNNESPTKGIDSWNGPSFAGPFCARGCDVLKPYQNAPMEKPWRLQNPDSTNRKNHIFWSKKLGLINQPPQPY